MSTADNLHQAILQLRETYPIRLPEQRAQNGKALLSAIADLHGGRLMERNYLGARVSHRFCCAAGHRFSSLPYRLFADGWCKDCHVESRKLGIGHAHEMAHAKGGECLSKQYIDVKHKLRWQCRLGHRWQAPLDSIQKGAWCPVCANKKSPGQMMTLVKVAARARGGRVLSAHYVDNETKLNFRCHAGHEWPATPAHILNGTWCPLCAGRRTPAEQLERLRQFAKQQGGLLLSDQYVDNNTKVRLRCSLGHEWSAVPDSLFRGHWCGRCAHLRRRTYEHRKSPARRIQNAD